MTTVMDRDLRLTGKFREQTDNPVAPVGFEVNNPWRVGTYPTNDPVIAKSVPDGEEDHLILNAFTTVTVNIAISYEAYGPVLSWESSLCNDLCSHLTPKLDHSSINSRGWLDF
jgi:hypothetical protein